MEAALCSCPFSAECSLRSGFAVAPQNPRAAGRLCSLTCKPQSRFFFSRTAASSLPFFHPHLKIRLFPPPHLKGIPVSYFSTSSSHMWELPSWPVVLWPLQRPPLLSPGLPCQALPRVCSPGGQHHQLSFCDFLFPITTPFSSSLCPFHLFPHFVSLGYWADF